MGIIPNIKDWLQHPFKGEQGDVIDWLLFFGLAAVCSILWTNVLRSLKKVV